MPYIRFRGARTPRGAVRELVRYEDEEAPCRVGHSELVAEARRHVEAKGLDAASESEALEAYLDDATYEGLKFIGGVCFVDGTKHRPSEEVIAKETYQAERASIEAQNVYDRAARSRAIEEANDLWRRPLPEHEAMRWRTRVEIRSHAALQQHVPYRVGNLANAYVRVRRPPMRDGSIEVVADLYHDGDVNIEDALLLGREAAELFADLLAVAAYAPASVPRLIGTTPTTCRQGVAFELASVSGLHNTPPGRVEPHALAAFNDSGDRFALRSARGGLSAVSPTEAFASFWNAAEVLAQDRATREGWKRSVRCPSCGSSRDVGWDLKRGFLRLYEAANVMDAPFDKHRSIRGRIQHGTSAGDVADQRSIHSEIGKLRSAAIVGASQNFSVTPQTTVFLSPDQWPITVWSCTFDGTAISSTLQRFVGGAAFARLPQAVCGDEGRSVFAGVSPSAPPDPLSCPPILNSLE